MGLPLTAYVLFAVAALAAIVPFAGVLASLYDVWNLKPEYSHGFIIPLLSLYLIWQRRDELRGLPLRGSWLGLALIAAGLALRMIGVSTTMQTLQHYAFLLVLYGLVLALTGPVIFRRLAMPLLILIFAIPLPSFFNNALSLDLQLLSSQLGVEIMRLFGVTVLLQGNVIDLGTYQLEVAEACSGLRYLFPLVTLAFIVAYVFRGPLWKRIAIILSSVPITVVMNSARIGFIGVTVDRWGPAMAQGALHEFEGWLVFMLSTGALVLTAMVLASFGRSRVGWRNAFGLGGKKTHRTSSSGAATVQPIPSPQPLSLPRTFIVAAVILLAGDVAGATTPPPHTSPPARVSFEEFPDHIGDWVGRRSALEPVYLDALKLDDYILADYSEHGGSPVNFYVAYYRTQDNSRAVHSPHDCIPGGGWEIQKLEQRQFPATGSVGSFPVNRAIIQLGSTREVVYYWFQERGRHLTNDYLMRWYLLWDALTRHRTDGALVRYVAALRPGAKPSDADAQILKLATLIEPRLTRFVPN